MDSQDSEQHCCTRCLALTGTPDGLRAACSEYGYSHWLSKWDLRSSAQTCPVCKIVWEGRSWTSTKLSGHLRIHAMFEDANCEAAHSLGIEHPLKGRALTRFNVRDSEESKNLVVLYASTPEDDLASAIVKERPVLTDVGGEFALEQARTWLSACEKLHTQCVPSRESPMPTRVLNVGAERTAPYVRLQPTSGQVAAYVALSYCWGGSSQPTTTKSNLANQERQIILKDLPQTIQDAVYITRSLRVPFLWIDALCIVQDDGDDRRREIKNMGSIYKNALLTIAASSAASVGNGFLHRRDEPVSVHLPMYLSGGRVGSIRIARWRFIYLSDEPLNGRGWTLQEHLLSRRMLLYTTHEMLWRCKTHAFWPARKSHLHYHSFLPSLPPQVFHLPADRRLSLRKQQIEIWPEIVSQYSRRALSIPGDRISALAGVAAELSTVWRDIYILGLWSKTFIRNLAWRRQAKQGPCGRLLAVPTWSWLSLSCPAEMWPLLHVEDAQLVPQNRLLPIVTHEDLADGRGAIRIRVRVLDEASFVANVKERYYNLDMDQVLDGKSVEKDSFVGLIGYEKSNNGALCLVLRAIDQDRFVRVGRLRSWGINWEGIQYRVLTVL